MPYTPKIFIAYSRKDESLLDELRTHLTPIERSGKVEIWYDGKIEPGIVWEKAIKTHLYDADIILLLVSADAIASDYFYDKEMKDAMERHEKGAARVVPLILRPCAWDATPLAKLQAIPKDGLAVTSWGDKDAALSDAVSSLWEMIQNQIADAKAMKAKEEQERQRKEADAKRELELGKEQAAAAKNKEEQAEEMERLEKEAQIRRQKREVEEKEKAEKQTETRKVWLAKFSSLLKKPMVWGAALLLIGALGVVSKLNIGKSQDKSGQAEEAEVEGARILSGKYHVVLRSFKSTNKVQTIKVVRSTLGFGLKDSKEIVERLPYVFEKKIDLKEAKKLKADFRKVGARLDYQPIEEPLRFSVSVESLTTYNMQTLWKILREYGFEHISIDGFKNKFPYVIQKDLSMEKAKEMIRVIDKHGGKSSIK